MDSPAILRTVTDPQEIGREGWKAFVSNHPRACIFQTPEYFDLCSNASGYSGVVAACILNERICGILVAVIQRDFRPPFSSLTARGVIWGGPLAENNNPEIISSLLEAYNAKTGRSVLFTQFRNLSDMDDFREVFLGNGYVFEEHLNILFNLRKGEDSLWADMHSTRRKQIKRSVRRDVKVSCFSDHDDERLLKCYSLLKSVYSRARLPLPDYCYFQRAAELFTEKKYLRVFTAEYRSEIIGFRMILCYQDTLYDWYAAASDDHLDKYPNDILPWEVILWGLKHGFNWFDFGGAGKPGKPYGVRDYKAKFGGEMVNFGRFTLIKKPLLYTVIMTLFRIRQVISGIR